MVKKMLSTQDATRMSNCGKEEDIKYHLSQMEYYRNSHKNCIEEATRSLMEYVRHKKVAEAIQLDLEGAC